jgi:hypothetical protein
MTKKPDGAVGITEARLSSGPWYTVNSKDGFVMKRALCPAAWWFPYVNDGSKRKLGYCFLNYFHALAYSLKRKAANDPDPS